MWSISGRGRKVKSFRYLQDQKTNLLDLQNIPNFYLYLPYPLKNIVFTFKCTFNYENNSSTYIYTMENYSAIQGNEIMAFVATWMDLEITMLK